MIKEFLSKVQIICINYHWFWMLFVVFLFFIAKKDFYIFYLYSSSYSFLIFLYVPATFVFIEFPIAAKNNVCLQVLVQYRILGIVRGKNVREFCKSGSICECFLALFMSARMFIYKISWITKVFSRTMVKKVICETFLLQMIPDIVTVLHANLHVVVNNNLLTDKAAKIHLKFVHV